MRMYVFVACREVCYDVILDLDDLAVEFLDCVTWETWFGLYVCLNNLIFHFSRPLS